jgi:hypothetical protein
MLDVIGSDPVTKYSVDPMLSPAIYKDCKLTYKTQNLWLFLTYKTQNLWLFMSIYVNLFLASPFCQFVILSIYVNLVLASPFCYRGQTFLGHDGIGIILIAN